MMVPDSTIFLAGMVVSVLVLIDMRDIWRW